jgi:hypothetical protein
MARQQTDVHPPLVTASWLRDHGRRLSQRQLDGESCCYCGGERRTMEPVGRFGPMVTLWACQPPCEPAMGSNRPE